MAIAPVPLQPKKSGPLRVLTIGRISTEHQQMESIAAMHDVVETQLRQIYKGPFDLTKLGEQASGMLVDRPTIVEAMQRIEDGEFDLVMVEDLSRVYRNPARQYSFVQNCVDQETRFIALNDSIDTADENWELSLSIATLRHGMYIPDTRKRVIRSATHSFLQGGMVGKVPFGYRKVSKEEAQAGTYGSVGLRIAKDPAAAPIIRKICDRVLTGESFESIAQWLNGEEVLPGLYVRKGRWTAKLLRQFLRMELLHGERVFRKVHYSTVYKTGKKRRVKNVPEKLERMVYPELAHLTPEDHSVLLTAMDARASEARHSEGSEHPLYRRPRCRTHFPRQHATCGVCGALMYPTESNRMVCSRALAGDCWNRVRPHEPRLRQTVLGAIIADTRKRPCFEEKLLAVTKMELTRVLSQTSNCVASLEKQRQSVISQIAEVTTAIALSSAKLPSLLEKLTELEVQRVKLTEDIAAAHAAIPEVHSGISDDEISERWPELLQQIAASSFEFADWIRKLIPVIQILPVQALDTGLVRSKVQFVVRWAVLCNNAEDTNHLLDVGSLPQHVRDALELGQSDGPKANLGDMARALGMTKARIKRARAYARLMHEAGLGEPYRLLSESPAKASRWRKPNGKQVVKGSVDVPSEQLSSGDSWHDQNGGIAAVG